MRNLASTRSGVHGIEELVIVLRLLELLKQKFDGELEIIIVDNGSSDDTALVTQSAAKTAWCPVKYVVEPELGLSRARNTGIAQAEGEIVIFISFATDLVNASSVE